MYGECLVNIDSSLWAYFLNAGLVVKLVLLLLISASIMSWTYIMQRGLFLKEIRKAVTEFEQSFWSGGDLSELYANSMKRGLSSKQGMEAIFQAGFKEFLRLHQQAGVSAVSVMEGAQRAMRVAQMREQEKLETHLPLLATVGSTSPYVGLFGTVWGIMLSFKALANVQQATISMVAPGIAEALIATAMGLFAAIPAVIAYNRYATDIGRLLNRFDAFQEEFANILFRQAQQSLTQVQAAQQHSTPIQAETVR
jgi:biopolymer transport protein TolQ